MQRSADTHLVIFLQSGSAPADAGRSASFVAAKIKAMNRIIVAILILLPIAHASGQILESAPVASVFRSVLPKVKSETKVPILLPSKLPSTVKEQEIKVVDGEGTENGYEVSLYYDEGCGNACFAGFFSAKRGEKPEPEFSDKVVRLLNGIKGYYIAKSCGVSCAPPQIEWLYEGALYTVQFKVNGKNKKQDEAEIVALANSAIQSGAR